MTRILFLDLDGVLNAHRRHANGYCGMDAPKLELLAGIVRATGCRIVLASAWRYLVLNGQMTLAGVGSLMLTHGAPRLVTDALVAVLPEDVDTTDPHDRGRLARRWLAMRPDVVRAVALDDGAWPDGTDLGYRHHGIPLVSPTPTVGLGFAEAEECVRLLLED